MSTQKKPRDPSVTTQLDGLEPVKATPAPKLKPAKKAKRPGSVFERSKG